MEQPINIFEQMRLFVADHPIFYGIIYLVFGILFLLSAIYDVDFIFRNTGSYNLKKIEGWVNMFGRKTARIIVGSAGAFVILISIPLIVYEL